MTQMKALVKQGPGLAVRRVPRPTLIAPEDVIVRVALAGLCRTDVYVAEGHLPCRDPLILGHEFAGVVAEVGPAVRNVAPGDRVTVMPILACRTCEQCRAGAEATCERRTMLGVDRDGGFAEFIAVPARAVYRLPTTFSFMAGAYMEPVAAALAVLKAGLRPDEKGLIYGHNRIALLTERVLRAHGFTGVAVHDPSRDERLPTSAYHFIVETVATTEALDDMIRAVRPLGTIVLKSRSYRHAGINLIEAVKKELTFRAVNYGPFTEAIALVAEGRVSLDGLLGPVHDLEEFPAVFAASKRSESAKPFFAPGGRHVWDR